MRNADGSIPAWTGGYTTLPAGWQPGDYVPDPFADEQPVAVINAANMAQYASKLSDGVQAMMTKSGFSIKVYPAHRTQAMPESVCAHIAQNVTNAKLVDPANPQNGFTGGFGGYPFPIPDVSNPLAAGAQRRTPVGHRDRNGHRLLHPGHRFHSELEKSAGNGNRL